VDYKWIGNATINLLTLVIKVCGSDSDRLNMVFDVMRAMRGTPQIKENRLSYYCSVGVLCVLHRRIFFIYFSCF
jgi:hypothetical protein